MFCTVLYYARLSPPPGEVGAAVPYIPIHSVSNNEFVMNERSATL